MARKIILHSKYILFKFMEMEFYFYMSWADPTHKENATVAAVEEEQKWMSTLHSHSNREILFSR